MTRPGVVIFDVNETLSDFAALRRRFDQAGAAPGTLDLWFASVLRDGIALAAAGGFATFATIGRRLLTGMLRGQGIADPGVPAGHAALVAVHPWDVDGAMRAGLASAHLDRAGAGYPGYLSPPTVTGGSLTAVAEALLAL